MIRNIITIDTNKCDGCGRCVISCKEGALEIRNGKARVVRESYCDGLGACIGECPKGALKIIQKDAAEFDAMTVEKHLKRLECRNEGEYSRQTTKPLKQKHTSPQGRREPHTQKTCGKMKCGCPSSMVREFENKKTETAQGSEDISGRSHLRHWPVQLNLVPADAPFLKERNLVLLADCAAVSVPDLHSRFLKDSAVVIGCPKFDDAISYTSKLADMFANGGVSSVEVVHMEVPCCHGLAGIVKNALKMSGARIPVCVHIASIDGSTARKDQ